MGVDPPQDLQLAVVDRHRQEGIVVDQHDGTVARLAVDGRKVLRVDEGKDAGWDRLPAAQLIDDGPENLDKPFPGSLAQDERWGEGGDRVLDGRRSDIGVLVIGVRGQGVHDPPDDRACLRSMQHVALEVAGARPRLVELLRLGDQAGVQHLDLDGGGLHRFGGHHREPAGVVVELDRDRCRQQVPQHRRVVRRRPRQTADSDNQLELLRVSQRVHVHREELAVQLTDRPVAALLVRPGLPVPEPLTERGDGLRSLVLVLDVPDRQAVVPDLVGGSGDRGVEPRFGVRVVAGPVEPLPEPVVRGRRGEPGHAVHGQEGGAGFRLALVERAADRRVVREVAEPEDGSLAAVRLDCAGRLVPYFLGTHEELEEANRAIHKRVAHHRIQRHAALPSRSGASVFGHTGFFRRLPVDVDLRRSCLVRVTAPGRAPQLRVAFDRARPFGEARTTVAPLVRWHRGRPHWPVTRGRSTSGKTWSSNA